jgi:hypothetical protein
MKVLFIAPQASPKVLLLEDLKLHNLQALVGGLIEIVGIGESDSGNTIYAVVNEEGLLHGMPPNRLVRDGDRSVSLVGNIVIVGSDGEGEFVELTSVECSRLRELVNKHWQKHPGTEYDIPMPTVTFVP